MTPIVGRRPAELLSNRSFGGPCRIELRARTGSRSRRARPTGVRRSRRGRSEFTGPRPTEYQLRHYRIRAGQMDTFVDAWLRGVYPLRRKFGFVFAGAWRIDGAD